MTGTAPPALIAALKNVAKQVATMHRESSVFIRMPLVFFGLREIATDDMRRQRLEIQECEEVDRLEVAIDSWWAADLRTDREVSSQQPGDPLRRRRRLIHRTQVSRPWHGLPRRRGE